MKPFPKLFQNPKLHDRLVFALFWFLIVFQLELFASRIRVYFIYAILGAAGAGELTSEYDYTDKCVADDYSHAGVHA
jgi:hypothetical protein